MLVEETFAIAIAIGVSTFAIFATRKDRGKIPFAFAAICSWVLLGATTFYDQLDLFLSSLGITLGPFSLNGDFIQGVLVLLVCIGAIVGFAIFAT